MAKSTSTAGAARKSGTRKTTARKAAPKKAPARRTAETKSAAKRTAATKPAAKKSAARKTTAKKSAARKAAPRKAAPRKAVPRRKPARAAAFGKRIALTPANIDRILERHAVARLSDDAGDSEISISISDRNLTAFLNKGRRNAIDSLADYREALADYLEDVGLHEDVAAEAGARVNDMAMARIDAMIARVQQQARNQRTDITGIEDAAFVLVAGYMLYKAIDRPNAIQREAERMKREEEKKKKQEEKKAAKNGDTQIVPPGWPLTGPAMASIDPEMFRNGMLDGMIDLTADIRRTVMSYAYPRPR